MGGHYNTIVIQGSIRATKSDYKDIIGAFIIRIGFCGILYHSYNKEPPKIV